MLQLFQIITFINGITILIFGIFIFVKNRKQKSVQAFSLFALSFALWTIAFSFQIVEKDYDRSLILTKLFMLGANFIPITFFYFICIIININTNKIIKYIIRLSFAWGIILSLLLLTPYYIDHLKPKLIFHWWLVPGLFFHLQFVTIEIYFIWCIYLVIRNYKIIGSQSRGLLIGTGIALIGGSSNYFLCYDFHIMPYLNFLIPIQLVVYVYYIMKYNIMNVRKYLLKGFVSYVIFSMIFSIPIIITFIYESQLKKLTGIDYISIIISIITLFIALSYRNTFIIGELEQKVEDRTSELHSAMEELEAMYEELAKTKDQLWGEMQLAKKIQTVLLPENPTIKHYEIFAYMQPANEVGGDYYDIINVQGLDWVVIGDVSGHGVPAGLIMMMVQTAIHSNINQNPKLSPAKLLTYINKTIKENITKLADDKYMTLTVLAVHDNGKFIFSGLHLDIMIYRSHMQKVEFVETNGIWIGIVDDVSNMMQNDTLTVDINDVILLYTDGITEAWRRSSVVDNRALTDMFGLERLKDIFGRFGNTTPCNIKEEVFKELEKYELRDDVTLVLIKRVN